MHRSGKAISTDQLDADVFQTYHDSNLLIHHGLRVPPLPGSGRNHMDVDADADSSSSHNSCVGSLHDSIHGGHVRSVRIGSTTSNVLRRSEAGRRSGKNDLGKFHDEKTGVC